MKIQDIINKQGKTPTQAKQGFKVEMIHFSMLRPSRANFYDTKKVEELADSMILSGGILQNLVVRKIGLSEYEIISGHKRCLAAAYNRERGQTGYEFLPCKVEEETADIISEIKLIVTNSTQRERSDYEKMQEVLRLKELIPQAAGEEKIKVRMLNRMIADNLGISETRVKNYQSIDRNLLPEAKEKFASGELCISAAVELAGMPKEEQKKAVERNASYTEIKAEKQEPEKIVSYSDTESQQPSKNTNTSTIQETIKKEYPEPTEEDPEEEPEPETEEPETEMEESQTAAEPEVKTEHEIYALKNNDQRSEFIKNYLKWPLWIETKETGERYYRYDLYDGTSMVVKVYHTMLFDYKMIGEYENRFREGYGKPEYYILVKDKFFKDCETNKSLMIEKIKEIQKNKREKR